MKRAKKKKTATRAAAKKKAVNRGRSRPAPVVLHEASPAQQAKVFRAVRKAMKEQGVVGEITALHLAPATRGAPQGCPQGQVARVRCFKRADGTVVCESRWSPAR
jgi:hypothetical protein